MLDLNAVDAHDLRIKLRAGEANAKADRSPYNLEQAIKALALELLDLNGPESLYHVMGDIAAVYAADKGMKPGTESIVSCAVEMVVNMSLPGETIGAEVAAMIVAELEDMELINQ